MAKFVLLSVAFLLGGITVGTLLTRHEQAQHAHARAVMTLNAFHLDRLTKAAKSGQCTVFAAERERLYRISDELLDAFPKAYAEVPEFRKQADALRQAEHPDNAATAECGTAAADAKKISNACDDCHRQFD